MSELGRRLKTARVEKGYSLEELQQITKIQKRYLIAIEEGDFSRMPGEFYSRAFVKNYAEAVGLDPNQIFVEHHAELPQPKKSQSQELPPRTSRNKGTAASRKKSNYSSLLPTILGLVLIGAVGLVVWIFYQDDQQAAFDNNNNTNETAEESNAANVDSAENEESSFNNEGPDEPENNNLLENEENNAAAEENENENEENNNGEGELVFSGENGNRYTYVLSGADELEVELSFSGPSWLLITNGDGDELHQQEHSDGDEETFDFSDETELIFNMGSTPTATLYINGEELEYESDVHHQYVIIEQDNS